MPRGIGRYVSGVMRTKRNTVARTDTTPKSLFVLPKGAFLIGFLVSAEANSNAATTAVLDIGKTGTQNFFVDDQDVRQASTPFGQVVPKGKNLGRLAADTTVTATYAETGTASSAGGPWTVTALYEG